MSDGSDLPFDVRVTEAGDSTVVAFTGDLDVVAVPRANRTLEDAQSESATVVLDLRQLRFMDSSGLRVVLAAQRRASDHRARLLVAPGEAGVRRLFELSGVGALIELVDAPPEAA